MRSLLRTVDMAHCQFVQYVLVKLFRFFISKSVTRVGCLFVEVMMYLESIGLHSFGFEFVVVGIERCEFGRQCRKFDQLILSQRQFFQEG